MAHFRRGFARPARHDKTPQGRQADFELRSESSKNLKPSLLKKMGGNFSPRSLFGSLSFQTPTRTIEGAPGKLYGNLKDFTLPQKLDMARGGLRESDLAKNHLGSGGLRI